MPKGKPFVKGDPRINRSGRPKALDGWRDKMRDAAEAAATLHISNIAAALALSPDDLSEAATATRNVAVKSASFVIEQGWGKATQAVEVTGKDGKDLLGDGAEVAARLMAELEKLGRGGGDQGGGNAAPAH